MGSCWGHNISSTDMTPPPSLHPDPARFKIRDFFRGQHAVALKVHYPDAGHYEGNKVIVIKGFWDTADILKLDKLDPHFSENGLVIARFAPTEQGWLDAKNFAANEKPQR